MDGVESGLFEKITIKNKEGGKWSVRRTELCSHAIPCLATTVHSGALYVGAFLHEWFDRAPTVDIRVVQNR